MLSHFNKNLIEILLNLNWRRIMWEFEWDEEEVEEGVGGN